MAQRSAGAQRSREPGARRERTPAPTGEVPRILQLGTALGNRTTTALLAGGLLQRKVAIGPADDPLEREADRVAERVLAQPESTAAEFVSSAGAAIQRKCAACAAGGQPCAECAKEDEELRREAAAGQPAGGPAPAQVDSHLATLGPGRPLPNDLRSYFEPRFDHDFSAVRLHTGSAADAAARAASARAFTLRQDVVFAAGQYTPETRGGRRLLAHELAHVVQQAPPAVRRQASTAEAPTSETSTPPAAEAEAPSSEPTMEQQAPAAQESETEAVEPRSGEAPKGLIVADDAESGPDQMTKTAFLDELYTATCSAAEQGLAGTGQSTQGCPWIEHYFRLYAGMSAERLEADLLRYVPATHGATSARAYIAPTAEHVRSSVERWAQTGEVTGVPQGLPGMGLLGALGGSLAGLGRLLFKARSGGARGPGQPAAVAARLGPGSPLAGSVRSRMENGLGAPLGGVRIHTDATASHLASRFNARAFAVGRHVAFGAGEYRPGTLAGEALLAHELAHAVQQGVTSGSPATASAGGADRLLEREADRAAVGALARQKTGRRAGSQPRLRTGLQLQRCRKSDDTIVSCVLEHVCPTDSQWVTQLHSTDVIVANRVYWDDPYYNGRRWTTRRFIGAGFSNTSQRRIGLLRRQSCNSMVDTVVHELRHQRQPAGMGTLSSETDAYRFTEQWLIDRGFPGTQSFRGTDPVTGATIVNPTAIEAYVRQEYPGITASPTEHVIGRDANDDSIVERADKTTYTRPPQDGDSYPGPISTPGASSIDQSKWVCP